MSHHQERAPDDALRNHPLRDTQEFESDIRGREPSTNDPRVGPAGAVGGAGGALAGAGLGTIIGGPVGAIVGAIAGAVGGWWAGQAAADPATTITAEDEARYRALYDESPNRLADRTYEDVRPFYHLGHLARTNPDYRERPFEEIEGDLQKGWTPELRGRYGEWGYARPFAREAFSRREIRAE
jgi:hypothetical protein